MKTIKTAHIDLASLNPVAERLGVKDELTVPPVLYCGLMNPEAFAMLKVCDQKDKGAPWEINHDK